MTIELPTIGFYVQLYLIAFCAFVVCLIASRKRTDRVYVNRERNDGHGDGTDSMTAFWSFIAICAGLTMVGTFGVATVTMIQRGLALQ